MSGLSLRDIRNALTDAEEEHRLCVHELEHCVMLMLDVGKALRDAAETTASAQMGASLIRRATASAKAINFEVAG